MKIEVQKKDEVAVISLGEDLEQSWTLEDLQSVVTEIGENIKKVILHGKELGNEAQSEIGDIACLIRLLLNSNKEVELQEVPNGLLSIPGLIGESQS